MNLMGNSITRIQFAGIISPRDYNYKIIIEQILFIAVYISSRVSSRDGNPRAKHLDRRVSGL